MPERILMLGATGTLGRATVRALRERGHEVVCLLRPRPAGSPGQAAQTQEQLSAQLCGALVRYADVGDPQSIAREGLRGERFEIMVSCMASRTGVAQEAWAIDHRAHSHALQAARQAGVGHMILLSALCVQKPLLEFQRAKLAFEQELIESGLNYSIVRPTAFFKSLSGQIERLRRGRPFLVFGDGRLTACKPISDADLADYLVGCIGDPSRHRAVLPIGGPGPALTPLDQGRLLFEALGLEPRYRQVPVGLLDLIIGTLDLGARLSPRLQNQAALARIGRYYATESMLVLNPLTGRYDEAATPSFGSHTLGHFYRDLVSGKVQVDRGDHAVF